MKTHKDLIVWSKSIDFVTKIYTETKNFPKEEIYGLISQIRRSAVSIPSNIAEGVARTSNKEFSHFLSIAIGLIAELETQLLISKNLNFLDAETFDSLLVEITSIRKMTIGLKKSLVIK